MLPCFIIIILIYEYLLEGSPSSQKRLIKGVSFGEQCREERSRENRREELKTERSREGKKRKEKKRHHARDATQRLKTKGKPVRRKVTVKKTQERGETRAGNNRRRKSTKDLQS